MHLHELGEKNEKVIFMMHGLAMSWEMFSAAVSLLSQDYHVIALTAPDMTLRKWMNLLQWKISVVQFFSLIYMFVYG